jgi:DNA-binding Xre family transcriptional regulator
MEQKTIILTYKEVSDLLQGLVIAMKELDKYEKGLDKIFADRLETICKKIEIQMQ